jgi:hypothetical protein
MARHVGSGFSVKSLRMMYWDSSQFQSRVSSQAGTHLAIWPDLGLVLRFLFGGNGPVNQEEVHMAELELSKGVVEGPEDVLVSVQVVPDLGGDEDILPLDGGVLPQEILEGLADLVFILVEPGTVKVTVPSAQGVQNRVVGLPLGVLVGEGAKPDTWDGDAVGELEGDSR